MALLTTDVIIQRLQTMPTFRGLAPEALKAIADKVEVQYASQGDHLYKIGQLADQMYIVESGQIILQEPTHLNTLRDAGRAGPGSVIGLEAAAKNQPYTQTALVAEPTTMFALNCQAIDELLAAYSGLRRRLNKYQRQQRRLNRLNLPGRLDDEVILVYARPHWTALLSNLIWPLIILLGVILFSAVLVVTLRDALFGVALIVFSLMAFALVALAYSFSDWWFDTYIVTNQRVISMLRRPFIKEELKEAPIGKIQNTSLVFPDFFAHYLGWSNISISTAGGPPIVFKRIARGPYVNAVIQELVAQLKQRSSLQANEIRQQQIEDRLRGVASAPPPSAAPASQAPPPPNPFSYLMPQLRVVQQDGQGTTITYRKHWIVLVRGAILWLLLWLFFFAVTVGGVATGILLRAPLFFIPLGAALAATFLYLWWLYEDWRNDLYVLTPSAVRDVKRLPLYLHETSTQAGLDAIQDVSYTIPNPFAEMFNYGDILIQTAGPQGELKWRNVPDPREVRREINERIADFQRRRAERARQEMDDNIQQWLITERKIQAGAPNTPPP